MSRMVILLPVLMLSVVLAACSARSYKVPTDISVPSPQDRREVIPLQVGVMIPPTMPSDSIQANPLGAGAADFEIGEGVVDGVWKMCTLHFRDAVPVQSTDFDSIDPDIDAIIVPQIMDASFQEVPADAGRALDFSVSVKFACLAPDDRTLWDGEFSGLGRGEGNVPEEIYTLSMQNGLEDLFANTVRGLHAREWWQEERHPWPPEILEQEIAGGWVNGSTESPAALEAAKFAAAEIAGSHQVGEFERLLAVRTQVVAGTNYSLSILLADGTVWQAVVYENLRGVHEVTRMERQK